MAEIALESSSLSLTGLARKQQEILTKQQQLMAGQQALVAAQRKLLADHGADNGDLMVGKWHHFYARQQRQIESQQRELMTALVSANQQTKEIVAQLGVNPSQEISVKPEQKKGFFYYFTKDVSSPLRLIASASSVALSLEAVLGLLGTGVVARAMGWVLASIFGGAVYSQDARSLKEKSQQLALKLDNLDWKQFLRKKWQPLALVLLTLGLVVGSCSVVLFPPAAMAGLVASALSALHLTGLSAFALTLLVAFTEVAGVCSLYQLLRETKNLLVPTQAKQHANPWRFYLTKVLGFPTIVAGSVCAGALAYMGVAAMLGVTGALAAVVALATFTGCLSWGCQDGGSVKKLLNETADKLQQLNFSQWAKENKVRIGLGVGTGFFMLAAATLVISPPGLVAGVLAAGIAGLGLAAVSKVTLAGLAASAVYCASKVLQGLGRGIFHSVIKPKLAVKVEKAIASETAVIEKPVKITTGAILSRLQNSDASESAMISELPSKPKVAASPGSMPFQSSKVDLARDDVLSLRKSVSAVSIPSDFFASLPCAEMGVSPITPFAMESLPISIACR